MCLDGTGRQLTLSPPPRAASAGAEADSQRSRVVREKFSVCGLLASTSEQFPFIVDRGDRNVMLLWQELPADVTKQVVHFFDVQLVGRYETDPAEPPVQFWQYFADGVLLFSELPSL